ncbi:recombinase family protein [Nocardia stercoris]|uniref:Recombinase family protein n=1 Tax=Nocardia stercoris TaxID=2483361 RepID=A0A3M2L795_9NOCA|nr:recombinase family protein [Nocardia stercoris]RMI33572.1 recombinase family protein [Nocardia stercoris]
MTTDDPPINPPAPAPTLRSASRSASVPVSGPSGLSDYAVSPLGMPVSVLRDEVRVAFLGRTSTEDQQDPRQSIIRQLGNSRTVIPESWVIVAHYYDIESGRMELDARGHGTDYERFDIPIARDGGVADLLDEASQPGRRFDVVICESVSRVARRAFEGLTIERELERAEVPLFAANEPITLSGSRAQRILQRRINQSVAEYEVLNTLEQSWGGLCTHVREGWNIGKPPYGYKAKAYRHPNPTKAAKGQTKSRLEPDGACGETVTQIALWRYHEGLGYDTIADRLNTDPMKYPPPIPPGRERARGAWGKTSVFEILKNPKYTGYQVFNRRASRSRRGKVNDQVKWVWSTEPAHEPLIPKWIYDELAARRQARRGSRDGNSRNTHPATRRTYVLRGMVFCGCGRRMFGTYRHDSGYYMCYPRGNNRGRPDKYADHPKALYLREDAVLDALTRFFADRVFGPHRRDLLAADLAGIDDRAVRERHAEQERLQRVVADVTRRQNSILRQAQDGDPDDPFTKGLRGTYNNLDTEKTAALSVIAQLDAADDTEPHRPGTADTELLDALPYLALNLPAAPEPLLRKLFEITQLTIRLHDDRDQVTITITLPADHIPDITHAAERITTVNTTQPTAAHTAQTGCVDPLRAPGAARTGSARNRTCQELRVSATVDILRRCRGTATITAISPVVATAVQGGCCWNTSVATALGGGSADQQRGHSHRRAAEDEEAS